MTVAAQATSVSYSEDGTTLAFPIPFRFLMPSDIQASRTDPLGVVTSLVNGTDYTVAGGGSAASGTLTLVATIAAATLLIWRTTPRVQSIDYATNDRFPSETAELGLDRDMLIEQEQDALASGNSANFSARALRVPKGESVPDVPALAVRAGMFLAFDAAGNPIALPGISTDDMLRHDLAQSSGSSLVGFIAAGAGATVRTVQNKLREGTSVKDFGAVGDGVTDDSTAFQEAVDSELGIIAIPEGQYLLKHTVFVKHTGVTLVGEGPTGTWIINGQTNGAAIQFGDGAATYSRCGIFGVLFGQQAGINAVPGNCALYLLKQSNFAIDDVQVFNFPAVAPNGLYDGIVWDNVTQSFFSTLGVQNCISAGLYFKNHCLDIYGLSSRSDANKYGYLLADAEGIYFTDCSGYSNTVNAFNINSAGAHQSINHYYVGCVGDTSGDHNWNITELLGAGFTQCYAGAQVNTAVNPTASGFYLNGASVGGLTFTGCRALANNGDGMQVAGGHRITIDGGMWGSGLTAGIGNGKGGAGSGIRLGPSAERVDINGGMADGNVSYGLDIQAGCIDSRANGVDLRWNAVGQARNLANATASNFTLHNVGGYNPRGPGIGPAVPASGVAIKNLTGVDCMVYIDGGAVSLILVDAWGLWSSTAKTVFLPAGSTIAINYTTAPTWNWQGL